MIQIQGTVLDPRNKDQKYNASPEGKARRKKYRHDNSKWQTDSVYLSRRIVAIDGEGVNRDDGSHDYIMLAISEARPLVNTEGLSTAAILRYVWQHMNTYDLNVIYGGNYDFNMWLKDLDRDTLVKVRNAHHMSKPVEVVPGYWIKWIDGKQFDIEHRGRKITIYDIVPFFQCPFIDACDQYIAEFPAWVDGREEVVREKAKRGSFTVDDVTSVSHYNQLELVLLVELATELRARLNRVSLRPRRWDGPGAIASALFAREGVKAHLDKNVPAGPAEAARYAYAGGRFEMMKYGMVNGPVYEYDINSAYPAALTKVPSLVGGEWIRRTGDPGDLPFALYRVRTYTPDKFIPAPVFVRSPTGRIFYPQHAVNWVWSPEMEVLREYVAAVPGATFEVLDCWEFRAAPGSPKPFAFINKLYAERQNLKAVGDGAEKALKLAVNSCYGKLAQQVGYIPQEGTNPNDPNYRPARIPPFHQLEWAGFVTSWCRSRVLRAALQNLSAVIAFETDALFTSEPLELPINSGLGAWEESRFSSLTYVQSGHYYATTANGKEVIRCRGIDRGEISREQIEATLAKPESARLYPAKLTRFFGAGIALVRGLETWCTWRTEPKALSLFPTGKRVHIRCGECVGEDGLHTGLRPNVWHRTRCPITDPAACVSSEYPVKWINPNPEMSELEEAREAVPVYDD